MYQYFFKFIYEINKNKNKLLGFLLSNPFKIRYNSNWIYVILSHWFSHQKIEIVLLTYFFFFYLLKLLKRISKHPVELWRVHSEKTTQWLNPKIRWHVFHMATCRLCLWKSTACTSNHFTRSPWLSFQVNCLLMR